MRTIVAVIVHNRFDNLVRWVECMKQCEGGELVIIHNYANLEDYSKYSQYCIENNVSYAPRMNVGFDIGAFQDVCLERLDRFDNNWDNMLWVTDDVIPMSKDFIQRFLNKLAPNTLPCMEVSKEVTPHIRTTGFMVTKVVSKKIQFSVPKITTKDECYYFEHRGKKETLYHQVIRMGLTPTMVATLAHSPLWDTGNKRHLRMNRMGQHQIVFKNHLINDKVTVICPIYNSYPNIIGDMMCQTHQNWELLLIHDGKSDSDLIKRIVEAVNDPRIKYKETENRVGSWGHKIRRDALASIANSNSEFVVITNPDNHFVPVFLEYMLNPMLASSTVVASYCSHMVHSYKAWEVIPCSMKRGYVDCAGVVIRKDVACAIGFNHVEQHSADWFFFEDIMKVHSIRNFAKVNGTLLIHN